MHHVPYNLLYVICVWRTWNYPTEPCGTWRVDSVRAHCCFRRYLINPSLQGTLPGSHLIKCPTRRFPQHKFKSGSPCLLQFGYSKNSQKLIKKSLEKCKQTFLPPSRLSSCSREVMTFSAVMNGIFQVLFLRRGAGRTKQPCKVSLKLPLSLFTKINNILSGKTDCHFIVLLNPLHPIPCPSGRGREHYREAVTSVISNSSVSIFLT